MMVSHWNTPGVINLQPKSKNSHDEKDVKSKWVAKAFAVDGIKVFDNDDQAAKRYCCLPTDRS